MKIISWNVAGFRAVLKKGFSDFFNSIDADIFCMQEVKARKEQIDFEAVGYYEYLNPAERAGYSGTLVYSKIKPINVSYGIPNFMDNEGRVITLEYDKFYLVNMYVPNIKPDLSRLDYRMEWEINFKDYIKSLEVTKPVIICGDFNVAHNEIDIKNPKSNKGHAGFTDEEREKFSQLLDSGLIDTFRYLYPDTIKYSWWTYLFNARVNNAGWRIDYFLVSKILKNNLKDAIIYNEVMGSDHCPVGLEIDI